ncbi:flagellar hook-basal body protein [Neomoorella humiferrea]|uniref:Flagellar basal-body rod protein FlgG n=1 Tax=Neomoorella humiferrea TaxID=676965 RepID=A0A2T0AN60_9FIRM|nr:flagellar hook-basal body protein [Moorella humiferrea]PRR70244.1 Flagellar basal-body rod protein FlgG [Moorella humiferrea]
MLRGLYLAATGMVVQEIRQDVIANNLANATTGGYKAQTAAVGTFPEMLLQRMEEGRSAPVGYFAPGVMLDQIYTNFAPGPLEETNRSTDLALIDAPGETPAFFTVQAGDTEAYTRNGSFHVDARGFLVTAEGYPVQGERGAVYVGTAAFKVDGDGRVLVDGQVIDRLRVVTFPGENLQLLEGRGDGLFYAPAGVQPLPAAAQIKQGWLERANVDLAREMVDMLAVMRIYEANQKAIQAADQTLGKSVNEVGSLR